ncbi:MAG: hypothetical protein WC460_05695 [Patescibacteria group bacterium]
MRKIILIGLAAILINFFYLSVSHGQTDVNVYGIVPETELNKNISTQPTQSVMTKENKYQYFFEKSLGLQQKEVTGEVQTIYDQAASWGLMALIMVILALILVIILRFVDTYLRVLKYKKD